MFKYVPLSEQTALLEKENARLKAENIQLRGDLDYIAMMTDIDLESGF